MSPVSLAHCASPIFGTLDKAVSSDFASGGIQMAAGFLIGCHRQREHPAATKTITAVSFRLSRNTNVICANPGIRLVFFACQKRKTSRACGKRGIFHQAFLLAAPQAGASSPALPLLPAMISSVQTYGYVLSFSIMLSSAL